VYKGFCELLSSFSGSGAATARGIPRDTRVLRKKSGFGVFAEIFSKNIMIPSREIPFFGEAPQQFWAIIAKFGCIWVFGYSCDQK
jgi:hypothetical protein